MIYKYFDELPGQINFVDTNSASYGYYEKEFLNLKNLLNINVCDQNKIDDKKHYLTINPDYYFKEYNKINLDLFIINIDEHNGHFLNLIKYIKTNDLVDVKYKNIYFKKFLFKNFPLIKIKSKINKILSFFNLEVLKYKLHDRYWLPIINLKEDIYRGYGIGVGGYNINVSRNKEFDISFKNVSSNLTDIKSKKIYKDTVYGKPSKIWENYYNLLFQKEHYQDYLNFNNSNIINLGVDNGYEIPFFITNKINKIINVDPTGEESLDTYVKSFVNNFKNKVIFEKSFLYDSKKVYVDEKKDYRATNLTSIIDKYDCSKNLIIKSDIEGFELKMLDELDKIVPKYRPQLAISIYHLDRNLFPVHSQLVIIPERLIKICKEYKFFINHYTYNRRETVFYCIPDNISSN